METKAKRAYKNGWDKDNTVFIGLKLNRHTDKDIIDELKKVDNMQGRVKDLIRIALNVK